MKERSSMHDTMNSEMRETSSQSLFVCIWVDPAQNDSLIPYAVHAQTSLSPQAFVAGTYAYPALAACLNARQTQQTRQTQHTSLTSSSSRKLNKPLTSPQLLFLCSPHNKNAAHFLANLLETQHTDMSYSIITTALPPSIALSFAMQAAGMASSITQAIDTFHQLRRSHICAVFACQAFRHGEHRFKFPSLIKANIIQRHIMLVEPHLELVATNTLLERLDPQNSSIVYFSNHEPASKTLRKMQPFIDAFSQATQLPAVPTYSRKCIEFSIPTHSVSANTHPRTHCPNCARPLYTDYCPVCHMRPYSLSEHSSFIDHIKG